MRATTFIALATSVVLCMPAWAQPSEGYGPGPGMMGGRGPGMMGGYGPGTMGGYGPGMMGGYGPGGLQNIPDLTGEQRDKINAIQKELRQKQWNLMEKMHDEFDSQSLYRDGKFDEQAARKAYDASERVHRQMFENSLDARKRIDTILTPQQRAQLGR